MDIKQEERAVRSKKNKNKKMIKKKMVEVQNTSDPRHKRWFIEIRITKLLTWLNVTTNQTKQNRFVLKSNLTFNQARSANPLRIL